MTFNHRRSRHWRPFATGLLLLLLLSALPAASAPHIQQTPGPATSIKQLVGCTPSEIYEVNNALLFFINCYDDNQALQTVTLWRSDSTEVGTVPIASLPTDYPISSVNHTNTTLFFWVNASEGPQLWKSDGTIEGTIQLKAIFPSSAQDTTSFKTFRYAPSMIVENIMYFMVRTILDEDLNDAIELWRSDGTVEGTIFLKQVTTETYPEIAPRYSTRLNNTLLLLIYTGIGYTLWRSDGTPESTLPVMDFSPNQAIEFFGEEPFNNKVLFVQRSTGQLWQTDGTAAGTVPTDVTIPPSFFSFIPQFGAQFFFTSTEIDGSEVLWGSNGTAECTLPLVRVPYLSFFTALSPGHSMMLFGVQNKVSTQLWKTDGTVYGTTLVRELPSPDLPGLSLSIVHVDNDVFLILLKQALPEGSSLSLWRSDGTADGTGLLQDGIPVLSAQYVSPILTNDAIYFWTVSQAIQGSQSISTLWKLPRTALVPSPETNPTPLPELGTHQMILPLVVDQC